MAYWIPLGIIRGLTGVFMVKSPEKDTASSVKLLSTIGAQVIPKWVSVFVFNVTCNGILVINVTARMCRWTKEEVTVVSTVGLTTP